MMSIGIHVLFLILAIASHADAGETSSISSADGEFVFSTMPVKSLAKEKNVIDEVLRKLNIVLKARARQPMSVHGMEIIVSLQNSNPFDIEITDPEDCAIHAKDSKGKVVQIPMQVPVELIDRADRKHGKISTMLLLKNATVDRTVRVDRVLTDGQSTRIAMLKGKNTDIAALSPNSYAVRLSCYLRLEMLVGEKKESLGSISVSSGELMVDYGRRVDQVNKNNGSGG